MTDVINLCSSCHLPCEIVEEVYRSPAAHLTPINGRHHTGFYLSECCNAVFGIDDGDADGEDNGY